MNTKIYQYKTLMQNIEIAHSLSNIGSATDFNHIDAGHVQIYLSNLADHLEQIKIIAKGFEPLFYKKQANEEINKFDVSCLTNLDFS